MIDEVRISIRPDSGGGRPVVGSDRGVVLSRVEFAPASGDEFVELFRPNLGDGAGPVLLTWVLLSDSSRNEYQVPANGPQKA